MSAEMTNREWLRSLSDEDLAEFMYTPQTGEFDYKVFESWCADNCEVFRECYLDEYNGECKHPHNEVEIFKWWLQQPHSEDEI